jgi:hypothetical protein
MRRCVVYVKISLVPSSFFLIERRKSAARFTAYTGFVLFELSRFVEYNRQVFREDGEVTVRGKYGELPADGYGTD